MKNNKTGQPITAPKKNGGGSANINSCAINKHGADRQFSASNPPLLLAANRYRLCLRSSGFQQKRRSTKAPISYLSGRIWERNWVLIFSLTS